MNKKQKVKLTKLEAYDFLSSLYDQSHNHYLFYTAFIKYCLSIGLTYLIAIMIKFNALHGMEFWEKILTTSPVLLLLLSAGNMFNYIVTINEFKNIIFSQKRKIILEKTEYISRFDLEKINNIIEQQYTEHSNNKYYKYGYILFIISIILIVFIFYWIVLSK